MKHPYFSIIVPTKNEEGSIEACLRSITNQTTNRSYEVILIDADSTDETKTIAKQFGVRIVRQTHPGKSHAFAQIVEVAHGYIVCVTEADCVVPPDWLDRIEATFTKHQGIAAVTGVYTFYHSTQLLKSLAAIVHPVSGYACKLLFGFFSVRSTNFAVKNDVFKQLKGFDARYEDLYDFELSRRLSKNHTIAFDTKLKIETSDRRFRGRILQYIKEFTTTFIQVAILKKPTKAIYADIR